MKIQADYLLVIVLSLLKVINLNDTACIPKNSGHDLVGCWYHSINFIGVTTSFGRYERSASLVQVLPQQNSVNHFLSIEIDAAGSL